MGLAPTFSPMDTGLWPEHLGARCLLQCVPGFELVTSDYCSPAAKSFPLATGLWPSLLLLAARSSVYQGANRRP